MANSIHSDDGTVSVGISHDREFVTLKVVNVDNEEAEVYLYAGDARYLAVVLRHVSGIIEDEQFAEAAGALS